MFGWLSGKKKDKEKEKQVEEPEEDVDEAELEKGIDPLDVIPDQPDNNETITDFSQDYVGYLTLPAEQIQLMIPQFKYYPGGDDERCDEGHKKGGRICADKKIIVKARSVGKEVIKEIGKKILSGSLNLTKISFPIKVSIPKSALETSIHGTSFFPLYFTKAALSQDPVERIKLVIAATLGSFFWTNSFLKPLNPVLGETLEGFYNDGTQIYCEQTSHHPPVSYFLAFGPNNLYRYYGYYLIEAKAGLNSVTILNKGKRKIEFLQGPKQVIDYDFPVELYSGTFMGTLKQESIGKMTFEDKGNQLKCEINLGNVKKKQTDYFEATVTHQGKPVSKAYGTYLGYIDFDGVRYWDYRYFRPFKISMHENSLESDHLKRKDLLTLKKGDIKQAQIEKEIIENNQRKDKKLREEKGGKKKH